MAVLLMHARQPAQARAELRAYDASLAGRRAPAEESALVARLLERLDAELGGNREDDPPLLSLTSAMAQPPPTVAEDSGKALSW